MRAMLAVVLLVALCGAEAKRPPRQADVRAACQAWIDAVTDMAVTPDVDVSVMKTLVDEDVFRFYTLPFSLGTPTEGYTLDYYQQRNQPVFGADPFVEYKFNTTKFYTTSEGRGRRTRHACSVHGTSSALTQSGRPYGQNYILTFELNRDLKLTAFYEYVDALYTACFFRILPQAVCGALGL